MKKTLTYLMMLTLICCGPACDRYLTQSAPNPAPAAGPTISKVRATVNDASLTLSWQTSDTAWADHYRLYLSDSASGPYVLSDSSADLVHTLDELLVDHRYWIQVAPVNARGIEGGRSAAISAYVAHLSMTINNDLDYTSSRQVTVTFSVPDGATAYRLAEGAVPDQAPWFTFAPDVSTQLSEGDGVKYLTANVQFGDGSVTGQLLSDSIILDTRARITELGFQPSGASFSQGDTITFSLDGDEVGGEAWVSFGTDQVVTLSDDGQAPDAVEADGIFTGRYPVPPDLRLIDGRVTGHFIDAAGNVADERAAVSLLTISSPPASPTLTATAVSTYQIRLTWNQSTVSDFAGYFLYRSTTSTVSSSSTLVAVSASIAAVSYVDSLLSAGTTYYYRLYVQNAFGQMSSSEAAGAATFTNTAPAAVSLAAGLESESVARLSWTVSAETDFAAYEIYWSTSSGVTSSSDLLGVVSDRNEVTYLSYVPPNSTRYYRAYVRDKHGLLSPGSNEVRVSMP